MYNSNGVRDCREFLEINQQRKLSQTERFRTKRIDQQVNQLAKCKWFSTLDLKSAYYQVPLAKEDRAYTAFEADGKLYQYCRLPFGVTNGVSCFQRIIDSVIADHELKQTFAYLDNITIGGFDKADHDRHF